MSMILARKLMAIAFCIGLTLPSLVNAADEEFLCEARQNSKTELPVLSKDCPVGKGIWGTDPEEDDGLFWIQCGFFSEAKTVKQVQPIYNVVSTDVWVKAEGKGYRCLIGPYEKYSVANSELANLKKLRSYKESFIRNATTEESVGSMASEKPKTNKPPKAKPKADVPAAVIPAVVLKEPKAAPKQKEKMVTKELNATETVVARRDVKIGDKYYAIPFLMDGYDQFYMEYGIAWNRLNYERALEVCESQKMRLPSADEWKMLIDSQVMSKKQWPLHLPYWGTDKQGLFTSGKVTQLTGTSLLNVVCVK